MRLLTTSRFQRDLRRSKKRGKDIDKLWLVVERLLNGKALDPHPRAHRMTGQWSRSRECHAEPGRLLIWHVDGDALILTRTGTHSDLFG